MAWLELPSAPLRATPDKLITSYLACLEKTAWSQLFTAITGEAGGGINDWITRSLEHLILRVLEALPSVGFIPAIRKITTDASSEVEFSRSSFVDRLARLQGPDYDRSSQHPDRDRKVERERFDRVNHFLQTVLGTNEAVLDIPYKREEVLTHVDGKTLPLSALGTGVQEVVVIATAATYLRNQVVCIEEPEIHLHLVFQRKLLRYFAEEIDNQYFIASHSAHFFDAPECAVWHVRLVEGSSRVSLAVSDAQRAGVVVDLGYRPSDLL